MTGSPMIRISFNLLSSSASRPMKPSFTLWYYRRNPFLYSTNHSNPWFASRIGGSGGKWLTMGWPWWSTNRSYDMSVAEEARAGLNGEELWRRKPDRNGPLEVWNRIWEIVQGFIQGRINICEFLTIYFS